MAKHTVSVPERPLERAYVTFHVKREGAALGTLAVSNGSVVWFPRGTVYGYKMFWDEFDYLMHEKARRFERR